MTALQPPILNLTRLKISSGCPSDFRMSISLRPVATLPSRDLERCCPPCDATPGCSSGRGGGNGEERAAPAHARRQID